MPIFVSGPRPRDGAASKDNTLELNSVCRFAPDIVLMRVTGVLRSTANDGNPTEQLDSKVPILGNRVNEATTEPGTMPVAEDEALPVQWPEGMISREGHS